MNDSAMPSKRPPLLLKDDDGPAFVFGPTLPELLAETIMGTTTVGDPDPKKRFATVTIEFWGEGYMERAFALQDHLYALQPKEPT